MKMPLVERTLNAEMTRHLARRLPILAAFSPLSRLDPRWPLGMPRGCTMLEENLVEDVAEH